MRQLRERKDYGETPKWVYAAFLVIVLAFGGIWLSSHAISGFSVSGAATGGVVGNPASEALARFLVVPSSAAMGAEGKAAFSANVQHEFSDGTFSVEISVSSKAQLERYGQVRSISQLRIPQPAAENIGGKPGVQRACIPSVQMPWGVAKVNGGSGGAGIKVAILDTGVAKHSDLKVETCKDATKRSLSSGCDDKNGHGTHVAGIVAANGGADGLGILGVAPDATLWAIKVCRADGTCWADDVAEGIYYAVNNGANIISMSFGANSDISLISSAIAYGVQHGVLFVAAAGNDGPADGTIDWPAANAKVIAVGALDSSDSIAAWSSRGINYQTMPYSVEERDIEFAAPGVDVESTWNDGCYRTLSGTSMAASHVAGLAAKVWQGSAAATRNYLQYIARYNYADIGDAGDDSAAGFGLPVATA